MFDKMLSGVKGALFTEEPGKPAAPPQPQPQARPPAPGQPAPVQWAPSLNQEMVAVIRKQTFARNTAFTALINASDALADIIPDQVMRLKAAHKTAGANRSPKEFADAVEIHLNDVNGEETRFQQALAKKLDQEVGGIKRQAEQIEQGVQGKQQEIQRLEERAQQLKSELSGDVEQVHSLRGQAQQKENDFAHSADEFKLAADAVRNELNTYKSTILSTLS